MSERNDENERRLASGWGRKPANPQPHDWAGETADRSSMEDADRPPAGDADDERSTDTATAADAGAISGRAGTREQQDLATGDTLGGPGDSDER